MAVTEKSGFLKYKDAAGNTTLMYPITTKDNVDGMDEIDAHIASTDNPHNVTKTQIGLSDVENKSSSAIRDEITSENVTNALGYTTDNISKILTVSNGIPVWESYEEATDDEIIDMLVEVDMMPVLADENGNIMTDETGAILLI